MAKHNKQMLFHAWGGELMETPFTPSTAQTSFLSGLQIKPLNPCTLEIQMVGSKCQHARAPAQGSAPAYALAAQEQGDIERDLELTSSHMNSKYADCCLLRRWGHRRGAEEVHRWDPGQHGPYFGFEPVEKEEQLGFMTQATL